MFYFNIYSLYIERELHIIFLPLYQRETYYY